MLSSDYSYELIELRPEELEDFFGRRDFDGVNVTIPYKEAVIPLLDRIDDAAGQIGAVNTVVCENGRLVGYNTDQHGMRMAILRAGIEPAGKKALICGTGGTSKTAEYVLRSLGARDVVRLTRRDGAGVTYNDAYERHADASVIVNTTPCGMYPDNYSSPIDLEKFPALEGVFDAVYNPLRTPLVMKARKLGIKAAGGLYMLVAQAERASELFRGTVCGKGCVDAVYESLLRECENVVLTGMPSSGKTTVGRLVADSLGKDFIDTDDVIVEKEGRTIPEIFSSEGEKYFRDAESEVIKEVSMLRGKVIATGGGSVLREENVCALKQNGRIFFLDRPLSSLTPTDDRPLSGDAQSLEKRYRERIDIYNAACDVRIENAGTAQEASDVIVRSFTEDTE